MHAAIYRKSAGVNCVIHFHDVYAIAMAEVCRGELPAIAHHSVMKLGSPVPILDIPTPGITDADMYRVEELFDRHPKLGGFIHVRHGVFALGKDPLRAFYNAELIEETAHIAFCDYLLKK